MELTNNTNIKSINYFNSVKKETQNICLPKKNEQNFSFSSFLEQTQKENSEAKKNFFEISLIKTTNKIKDIVILAKESNINLQNIKFEEIPTINYILTIPISNDLNLSFEEKMIYSSKNNIISLLAQEFVKLNSEKKQKLRIDISPSEYEKINIELIKENKQLTINISINNQKLLSLFQKNINLLIQNLMVRQLLTPKININKYPKTFYKNKINNMFTYY